MSISNFQEKFIKGPIGKAVLLFSAVGMLVVGFSSCGRTAQLAALDEKGNKQVPFATVGSVELPVAWIDQFIEEQTKQFPPGMMDSIGPTYKAGMYAQAVNQLISQAHLYEYASRNGYKSDNEDLLKMLKIDSEATFKADIKQKLIDAKQLPATATDSDLDKKIAELAPGKTFVAIYKEQKEQVDKVLNDKSKRPLAVMSLAAQYMTQKLEAGMKPTDDDVKKSFEVFDVKQITVKTSATVTDAQAKEKAQKAYDALKTGTSFEAAMMTYSEEPAPAGKQKSDNILSVSKAQIESSPDMKPILALQPGDYTTPTKVFDGYSIFKYAGKKVNTPKDYDANKDNYRKQFVSSEVNRKITEELKVVSKEVEPRFSVKAYEAAYLFGKASMPEGADALTPNTTAFQKVIDVAKQANANEPGFKMAVELQLAAIERMATVPGADVAKLKPQRIEIITKYLEFSDLWQYRKELIDAYKEEKNGDKAYNALLVALDKNNKYDQAGQQNYSEISGKYLELKSAGLVKPEQEKEFIAKQEQWQKEKKTYDEMVAREKALQEAEQKKAAEEAKKAAASAPKSESKPKGK